MDKGKEERERGITMNITSRTLNAPNILFTLIDTPGHPWYVIHKKYISEDLH